MFQVGDRVVRSHYNDGLIKGGTLGRVVVGLLSEGVNVKWDNFDKIQNYSEYAVDKYMEKVVDESVGTKLKTWEMLRDIKVGDTWKSGVRDITFEDCVLPYIVWGNGDVFEINKNVLNLEWTKVPKLVNFAEAWAAYEEGKSIRSCAKNVYNKSDEPHGYADTNMVSPNEIRGKWEIL